MLVFVGSRFRADSGDEIRANVEVALRLCRLTVQYGHKPFAPHLLFPRFLDDSKASERELGLEMGKDLMRVCDAAIFCDDYGVSDGMKGEISYCHKIGKPYLAGSEDNWFGMLSELEAQCKKSVTISDKLNLP